MSSIHEKAMLVSLNISSWSGRKYDREVSKRIEEEYNAHDAGRYNKILIAVDEIKSYLSVQGRARSAHYFNTLPWLIDGSGILLNSNYFNYCSQMNQLKEEFYGIVDKFCKSYPEFIDESRIRLGELFRESDYPHPSVIAEKFSFDFNLFPIPAGDDFRVNLQSEEIQKIRQNIEKSLKLAEAKAMRGVWMRLFEVLKHFTQRIADPEARFQETTLTNLVKLVQILPGLNLSEDPMLDQMRKDLESQLIGLSAKDLRENKDIRKEIAVSTFDTLGTVAIQAMKSEDNYEAINSKR